MDSYSSDSSYSTYPSETTSISDVNSPQNFQRGSGTSTGANSAGRATNVKCRYFMNNGYCFYGEQCQFVHVRPGNNNAPRQKQDSFASSEGISFNY